MKKIMGIMLIAATLVACTSTETEADKEERFTSLDKQLHVTKDKETGCKYIVYSEWSGYGAAGGITPLMKADGTQDCQ